MLTYVIPVIHPAAILRGNKAALPLLKIDLERAARLVRDGFTPPALKTYGRFEDLVKIVTYAIAHSEGIAVDIETDGVEVGACKITCLSFGNTQESVSFEPEGEVWEYAKTILANEGITKIFHNGLMFDCPVLERHGAPVR